jgi:predicted nucleotidyltransferase
MSISLKSKITQKILNYAFIHEEDKFYISKIAKQINEEKSNVYKKLLELKKEGVLDDDNIGNQRHFFLNKKYRFLEEYKKVIQKSFGIEAILKEKLSKIKGIEQVYLFGSYAKNQLTASSDIDILIIGQYDFMKVQKILNEIQSLFNIEVNSVEYSPKEYDQKIKEKNYFVMDILKNKIIKII